MLELSIKTTEIQKQLRFLYRMDFTDITQYVFLKSLSESFAPRSLDVGFLNVGTLQ